jgi:ABC-type branched-subunit amino acid transport system ATPase component
MVGDALTVERVGVTFGLVQVLNGVPLEVAPAEFVAPLGSSGGGKTTLLRAISGLPPVQSGRILIAWRDITGLPPATASRSRCSRFLTTCSPRSAAELREPGPGRCVHWAQGPTTTRCACA